MPPPRWPFGRNAFQQFHVGESQHPPVPGPLDDDVQRDHRGHDQQEQEEPPCSKPDSVIGSEQR